MKNSFLTTVIRTSCLLVALSLSLCTFGQSIRKFSTDGTTAPALEPGAPAGSFALSGFDNVNLFNGNMNFSMPILKVGGRGSASYSMGLKIEKKWRIESYRVPTGYINCGLYCYQPVWGPAGQHYYPNANWWSPDAGLGPGKLVGRWGGLTRPNCTSGGAGGDIITSLSFVTNDGSEISFRDDLKNGAPTTLPSVICSSAITGTGSRGTSWHATDGSGASFVSDTITYDSDISGEFYPSGYLLTKDGTRSRIDNGNVTWTRDRNGNKLAFTYDTYSRVTNITDSLNRQITASYGTNVNDSTFISYKGFGGAVRTIEIGYNSLGNVLRPDQAIQTTLQLFPSLNDSSNTPFNPNSVVAYVKLPDGRNYNFKYNSYQELARVELPTGGAFEYDWDGVVYIVNGDPDNTQKEIRRWVTKKRIYDNGGSGTGYTSVTNFASSQGNSPTLGSSTMLDANGTQLASSWHYFYGGNFIPGSAAIQAPYTEGKEYSSVAFGNGGTLMKTTNQTWENRAHLSWWTHGNASEPANDPRVTDATTTLNENNLVSKVHTDFDDTYPYNNPKDVWEYDYGTGAPGALLRRTHTEYAYIVNGLNYATDTNIHLRGLPSLMQVFDAASVKKSETSLEYDVYSGTNHATLVDRSGIVGLDSVYTTSKTTRGNVTGVTQWVDNPSGYLSGYAQYDIAGNVVKSIDAKGNSDSVGYTDNFSNISNNIGTFAFVTSMSTPVPDAAGTYASNTALTVATKYDYDSGKAVSFTDANNQITTMDYTGDVLDRPKQVNKPDGGITTFVYGDGLGFGNLYVRTQNKLNATQWTDSYVYFDGLGRAKQSKAWEGGTTWSFKDTNYDALGRAYQVSNPYRTTPTDWTTTTFDQLGRATMVTSPDGAHVDTAYYGNQVTVTDQAGKQRRSETDAHGRLVKVWEAPNDTTNFNYLTSYAYDTLDNLTTVTQGAQTRSFVYDSLKRLKQATNPESGTTTYVYDNNSNLLTKTDARAITTTYAYDALNRNTTIGYSAYTNGTAFVETHYDYAPNGKGKFNYNVKYNTETNGALSYNYDQINGYDALGRPTSKSQNFIVNQGGWTWKPYTTSATYDLAGNVLSQTYPSGRVVNYAYDVAARTTSFTGNLGGTQRNYSTALQYDAAGHVSKETFGTTTPLYQNFHYNIRQQLYDVRVGTNSNDPLSWDRGALEFLYGSAGWGASNPDNNGNITRSDHWIPDASGNWNSTTYDYYGYDGLNRVASTTEYTNSSSNTNVVFKYSQQFDYDRYGNRTINQANTTTSPDINKKLFSVNNTNNRLGVPGGQTGTMNYDAAGNLTFDSYTNPGKIEAMTYDAENHMTSAANSGHQYRYNAEGKRVKRIIAAQGEFWMVYGIGGELVAEYNATSGIPAQTTPSKEYGYRNGQMLVIWDDTETNANLKLKWLVQDQLGSTRMEIGIDGAASAVVRHDYLPFGEEVGGSMRSAANGYTVTKTKQKFTSKQRDDETGLDFFEARFMASVQGRFISVDPLMASAKPLGPQSWNRYSYCYNNPTRFIDPDGMDVQCLNGQASQYVLFTLPEGVRKKVSETIGKDGLIKKNALDKIKSKDENFLALKELVNGSKVTEVTTDTGVQNRGEARIDFYHKSAKQTREDFINAYVKSGKTRAFAIETAAGLTFDKEGSYGYTQSADQSPSGNVRVIVANGKGTSANMPLEERIGTTGHELYIHALLNQQGKPYEHSVPGGPSESQFGAVEDRSKANFRGQAKQSSPQGIKPKQ